jgi:hypothetical protein
MQLSEDGLTLSPKSAFAWPVVQHQSYGWARSKDGIQPDAGLVSWRVRLNRTNAVNQDDFWVGVASVTADLTSTDVRQEQMWVFGSYQSHINDKVVQNYNFARGDVVTLEMERRASEDGARDVNTLRIRVDGKRGMELTGLPRRSVLFPVFYLSCRCSYTIVLTDEEREIFAHVAQAGAESKQVAHTGMSGADVAVNSDESADDANPSPATRDIVPEPGQGAALSEASADELALGCFAVV